MRPRISRFLLAALAGCTLAGELPMPAMRGPVDTLPRHAAPHFNFLTLLVADPARALTFYTQVLGMHERGRAAPSPASFEIVVGYDDAPLGTGISLTWRGAPPRIRGNGATSINLVVQDLSSILAKVAAGGGRLKGPLQRGDSTRLSYSLAHIEDPDGNAIELVEYHRIGPVPASPAW
jgi:predicted enzyme related to lactoylglutathione lyase